MHDQLKLYVRGFFGSKTMSTETYQSKRNRPVLSVFDLNPEAIKHVVCNESVVEIYNQMIRRQVIHTDFQFRERAIKVALQAFGTMDFSLWAMANKASPTITQTHADFITDTARFITTGNRELPVGTWESLIGPGTNDPTDKITYDERFFEMLPRSNDIQHTRETKLSGVLAAWLARPTGFTDMVTSLYTFFGESNSR